MALLRLSTLPISRGRPCTLYYQIQSQCRRHAHSRVIQTRRSAPPSGSHHSTEIAQDHHEPDSQPPRVRIIRPGLWALAAVGTIYTALAYLDVRDYERLKRNPEKAYIRIMQQMNPQRGQYLLPLQDIKKSNPMKTYWERLDPVAKLTMGILYTNAAISLATTLAPSLSPLFYDIPAWNLNFTMLTSAFGHGGLGHLAINMYALSQFFPALADTELFRRDAYHAGAFYLSTAIVSSYVQRLNSLWQLSHRINPSLGASGALFACVGAFTVMRPDTQLGILFIPIDFSARDLLPCLMLFDLYGAVFGFKRLRLGHGAHLGGALVGVAYAYFDGKKFIWDPLTRALSSLPR